MALLLSSCTLFKILHNLKFFIVLGLQSSQELKTMLANVFAICFFGGGRGRGDKQGASWDNAHMANRVKWTLF